MSQYKQNIYEHEEENLQSKLNAAGLINVSLERLWMESYNAMAAGDLVKWNRKLDAIWNILGGDCLENGPEDKEMIKINLLIYRSGSLRRKVEGFKTLDELNKISSARQYILLNKKALYLRRLQNKQGKGTAYINPEDDDFD